MEVENTTGRNVIADALRGVAGLCILLFHLSEPFGWPRLGGAAPVPQICGHGYLCVEFFLLLMGFMLARAYDRRWQAGMTFGAFCKRRLLRLHPLVVSGSVIGFLLFLAQLAGWAVFDYRMRNAGLGAGGALGLLSLTFAMIPCFGWGFLNPFNPCSWTLHYEYVANALYGLWVRRFGKVTLLILSALAACWTVTYVMHVDFGALVGLRSDLLARIAARHRDSIEVGWGVSAEDFYGGFVRLCFPFFFGLLLSRLGWKIRLPKFGLSICLAAFLALLFVPMPFGSFRQNGAYELFALFVALPTLLLASEGTEVRSAKAAAFWAFVAEMSYPVYMTHYPFMRIHNWWVTTRSSAYSPILCLAVCASEFVLLVGLSYLVKRFYDERVRRWFA